MRRATRSGRGSGGRTRVAAPPGRAKEWSERHSARRRGAAPRSGSSTGALTVSPNGPVFAADLAPPEYVYRSTNQGGTWVKMDDVVANTSDNFNGFVADPVNSNLIYLSGLFTRTDFLTAAA